MKKTIRKIFLSAMMLGSALMGKAQVTNWIYGNGGGIQFAGGTVTPFLTSMNTTEACAVLHSSTGALLAYSNGISIWNSSNQLQYTGLSGGTSSTQGVAMVPIPGTCPVQAFVFTLAPAETSYGFYDATLGVRVTKITISPSGTITPVPGTLSIRLTPPNVLASEKLAVTTDNNGGYWVLTHTVGSYSDNNNTVICNTDQTSFYAFHVTASTLTPFDLMQTSNRIQSNVSTAYKSFPHNPGQNGGISVPYPGTSQFNGQGQMKFSKDGLKIATVLPWYGAVTGYRYNPLVELYSFNKSTGVVSNRTTISPSFNQGSPSADYKDGPAGGLEFSENGNILYICSSFASSAIGNLVSRVYQFDLTNGASQYRVIETGIISAGNPASQTGFQQLLRGPDDKIYISRQGYNNKFDVINNPNVAGSGCGYVSIGQTVGASTGPGMPTVVFAYANPTVTPAVTGQSVVCQGTVPTFNLSYSGSPAVSHIWRIFSSNASGQPIDGAGNVVNPYGAAYFLQSNGGNFTNGGPPASITATGANVTTCNRYYTAQLVLQTACGDAFSSQYTTRIVCNDPTFSLTITKPNSGYFTLLAHLNDQLAGNYPGYTYAWQVIDLDLNNNNWLFKVLPDNWWIWTSDCTFRGFDHPNNITNYPAQQNIYHLPSNNPDPGRFLYGHKYRISHGSQNNACPWVESSIEIIPYYPKGGGEPEFKIVEEHNTHYIDRDKLTGITANSVKPTELFSVYPNPSNGLFTVELLNDERATMEVFDITGKMIKTVPLHKNESYKLDLSDYSKGIYMIKMNGAQQELKRIVID